jgi:hypothetical protein
LLDYSLDIRVVGAIVLEVRRKLVQQFPCTLIKCEYSLVFVCSSIATRQAGMEVLHRRLMDTSHQ